MMTLLSILTLFFSILCIVFICYALWNNKIFHKNNIILLKRYRFYERYISICTYHTKHSIQVILASIEPDTKTLGDNIIFRQEFDITMQSRNDAVRAMEKMIVSSFKNTIDHIEENTISFHSPDVCSVRCPADCDCKYSENTEMT